MSFSLWFSLVNSCWSPPEKSITIVTVVAVTQTYLHQFNLFPPHNLFRLTCGLVAFVHKKYWKEENKIFWKILTYQKDTKSYECQLINYSVPVERGTGIYPQS